MRVLDYCCFRVLRRIRAIETNSPLPSRTTWRFGNLIAGGGPIDEFEFGNVVELRALVSPDPLCVRLDMDSLVIGRVGVAAVRPHAAGCNTELGEDRQKACAIP